MPIYEYRCDSCGHEFETIQKLSEAALTTCPACAEESLRKKVSASGFRLKGGGWYETDFKAGNNKKNVAGDDSSRDSASKNGGEKASTGSGSGSGGSGSEGGGAKSESGSSDSKSSGGAKASGDGKSSSSSAKSSSSD